MKVVYAGAHYGTCLSRFNSLQKLVDRAEFFAIDPYFSSMGKLHHLMETTTFWGPRHAKVNADLLAFCRTHKPDVVWIDRSVWVWPSTLRALRAQGAFLVHHFTDGLFPRRRRIYYLFRLLRKTLPLYDLNFPSNALDHAWMASQPGIRSELTHNAFDADRFDGTPPSADLAEKWASDALFVGHHEPRTERGILALMDAGLPVKVYGQGWNNAAQTARLRSVAEFRPLSDQDYVNAIKGAKIGLCFLSEMNYNQTTGRSFEIPACGTFLLGMRTDQHLELYQEGIEAEFFSDNDELVRKTRYYLENDDKRREIARRGHERAMRSDYSWQRYMRDDWGKVLAAMNRDLAARAG
jgi:spore maturation protein CgeB